MLPYCVQPILPVLREFGVFPPAAAFHFSISTAMLAIAYFLPARFLMRDIYSRKPYAARKALLASCCTLLSTMMTSRWYSDYARADRFVVKRRRRGGNDLPELKQTIPALLLSGGGLYSGNSIGGMKAAY